MTTAATVPRSSGSGRQVAQVAKRNWLSEIKTAIPSRPTAAILYGVPGIGKTSIGANIPGALVLYNKGEDGISTLKNAGRVPSDVPQIGPIETWSDGFDAIDALIQGEHSHKCLVIDALGGFEGNCHDHCKNLDYEGSRAKFMAYHNGFNTAVSYWKLFLNKLDELRDKKQMSVMLLGHAQVDDFKNPEGPDFDRWLPQCHEATWAVTHQWADMVLFANYIVAVDKEGKGQGGVKRFLYTQFHPAYDAKNRYGLPSQISMGDSAEEAWGNIVNALQTAKGN